MAALKLDLAVRTRRGLPMIIAACFLWTLFALAGISIPAGKWQALVYLFGAGMLVPLGLAASALFKIDLFVNDNPLSGLLGYAGGAQILFAPILIATYFAAPSNIPWFLAVLVGAHFLPFAWIFESRSYIFAAVGMSLCAGLSAWLWPNATFVVTPSLMVLVLILTVFGLWREHSNTLRRKLV